MLRTWKLKLVLDRSGARPLGAQIVRALIDDIRAGRISPGAALPGSRVLADTLGVSRKTVVQAFDELVSQGWIASEPKRGTFVVDALPSRADAPFADLAPSLAEAPAVGFRPGAPSALAGQIPEPGMVVLDDGLPDARLLPSALIGRALTRSLAISAAANALHYGDPCGDATLRAAIAAMLAIERGVPATADNICLTRGSQMAIHLVLRLFAGPGDCVAIERLGYGPVRDSALAAGAEPVAVAQDEQGMDLGSLEALCRSRRIRVVYLTPHHQFPTTVSMRPERRMRLLALAEQFGFIILEDDYDHEFHFEGRPLLPLIGADRFGRVAYVGSFSKLVSPALRLGYIAGPAALIRRAGDEILLLDRMGDPIVERAVAGLMQDGVIRAHAKRALRIYAERRQHAAALLRTRCGDWLEFRLPPGGLAFWGAIDAAIDPVRLREEAALRGLVLLPGSLFSIDGGAVQGLRIGFASLAEPEFADAVARLDGAARSCLAGELNVPEGR